MVAPRDRDELAEVVATAAADGRRVRPIGTGHSFTGVGVPVDVQLRLDHLAGVLAVDHHTCRVTVEAGIPLHRLNRALFDLGLSLTNLGDIEEQTIAGAISTGTHGSGLRFGGLATQVVGLELVLPDGSTLVASETENADVLSLARVGLGALGVIVSVTLQAEPAFAVHAREGHAELDDVLARFEDDIESTDHVDLHWFPHTSKVLTKHNERRPLADGLAPLSRVGAWWDDEFLANGVYPGLVGVGRRVPRLVPPIARFVGRVLGEREFRDVSYRVFASRRAVRFEEMEYAVPREDGLDVVRELVDRVTHSDWRIAVPVEIRTAAADDVALSTAYGRDSVYVAVHTAPGSPDREAYFATLEQIAGQVGGRPHWGKLHHLDADVLRERYPRFEEFRALRDRLDPDRVLTNPYLDRVLG